MHWARKDRHGDINHQTRFFSTTGICCVEACGKSHHSNGYCSKHYARFVNYGDPNKFVYEDYNVNPPESCTIAGCTNPHRARGLCVHHYSKLPRIRQKNYETTAAWKKTLKGQLQGKAGGAVRRAIDKGQLKRQPCEKCGSNPAQAHHCSYLPTEWLKVQWLCERHHKEWHRFHKAYYPPDIPSVLIQLSDQRKFRSEQ